MGPTATGKSSLALEVAEILNTQAGLFEIVSADSMCVYRHMNIGTAKVSTHDQTRIPHHIIDVIDPDQEFSVSQYQQLAKASIREIESRMGNVIVVGGTGLYVRSVVDPLEIPGRWPLIRTELEDELVTSGEARLYTRLKQADPLAASRIEPTNSRRVIRALEVVMGAGRPFSSFGPGLETYMDSEFLQIGLDLSNEELDRRIEGRLDQQLRDGFVEEVAQIRAQGFEFSRTALKALGYSEICGVLSNKTSLEQAREAILNKTKKFARRQRKWFRRDPRICWLVGSYSSAQVSNELLKAQATQCEGS